MYLMASLVELFWQMREGRTEILILLILLTNLYTGYFYSYIIFTLGTYIYCYHRSPVKINLKDEKRVYIKKEYIKKERKNKLM